MKAKRTFLSWGSAVHRIVARRGDVYRLACGRRFDVGRYFQRSTEKHPSVGYWSTEWNWDPAHPQTCKGCNAAPVRAEGERL